MSRKRYLPLMALLASATLGAGCGGDGDGGGGGNGTTGGGSSSDPNVQQVVDSCKQSVDSAQGLSEDVKKDLDELCEDAGSTNEEEARKASQEVCVKIVEETIPEGPLRDQSVEACEQTAQ